MRNRFSIEVKNDCRNARAAAEMPKDAPPDLLTRSLVIIAVNVFVISLIISLYEIEISIGDSLQWCLATAYEASAVERRQRRVRTLAGILF